MAVFLDGIQSTSYRELERINRAHSLLPTKEPCEHCGLMFIVSNCFRCGAPVCCPRCCEREEAHREANP